MTPSQNETPDHSRHHQARAAMRRCWMLTGGAITLTGVGLAGCMPTQPEPAPIPAPAPAPAPAPTITVPTVAPAPADWRDAPITPGNWAYRADARATRALFGATETQFVMACEPGNRQIRLWRTAPSAANGPTMMTITTTSETKTLAVQASTETPGQVVAMLAPHDPIIDAMIFSRGRFAVAVPGTATLYMPSWAEIARVAEDCR